MPKGVYVRKNPPTPPRRVAGPLAERFWSKVDKNGPIVQPELGSCWMWTAAPDGHGYGKIQTGTMAKPKYELAHRVAWRLEYGTAPIGYALHKCDVKLCVRPDHLFEGTQADNLRDMAEKGRSTHGERARNSKLTDEIVLELRRMYDAGLLNQSGAARKYGVSVALINEVVHRKAWKHVG